MDELFDGVIELPNRDAQDRYNSPKAYYLAVLEGDWRVESYITERVRKLQELQRCGQEEALRREHERPPLKVEKRLAAALDAVIATLPADERQRLEAAAEARVRQRKPVHEPQTRGGLGKSARAEHMRIDVNGEGLQWIMHGKLHFRRERT